MSLAVTPRDTSKCHENFGARRIATISTVASASRVRRSLGVTASDSNAIEMRAATKEALPSPVERECVTR